MRGSVVLERSMLAHALDTAGQGIDAIFKPVGAAIDSINDALQKLGPLPVMGASALHARLEEPPKRDRA